MQILNFDPQGSAGARLGESLGTGLEKLAQAKLQQLQQQGLQLQKHQALTGLGFSPQEAQALSGLPTKLQELIIPAYLERAGIAAQAQSENETPFEFLQQQAEPAVQAEGKAVGAPFQPNLAQRFQVNPLENVLQGLMQKQAAPMVQPQVQAAPAVQQQEAAKAAPLTAAQEANKAERIAAHKAKKPTIAEVLTKPSAKALAAERKETIESQKAIDKETLPYYESTIANAESAKKADSRLNKMENLVKKGGLPTALFYNFFKNIEEKVNPTTAGTAGAAAGGFFAGPIGAAIGGGIGALISPVATLIRGAQKLINPNQEQFEKLSADFIKEAKTIFGGGRLTDADLAAFMQMIPTLSQTDSGKLQIINNLRAFNKGAEIKEKAMRQIIHENGGKRPANLAFLVEERAKKQLDKIAQEFEAV